MSEITEERRPKKKDSEAKYLRGWFVALIVMLFVCWGMQFYLSTRDHLEEKDTPSAETLTEETQHLKMFYQMMPVMSDAELREHCRENFPEAVYPEAKWTTGGVIRDYLEHTERWINASNYMGAGGFILWSQDYRYCFGVLPEQSLHSGQYENLEASAVGWLTINGVRVCPVDEKTYDLSPRNVVQLYHEGVWDGEYPLRSDDYSTTVTLSGEDGHLIYRYYVPLYGTADDPEDLAYNGYDAEPWWDTMAVSQEERAEMVVKNYDGKDYKLQTAEVYQYVDLPRSVQVMLIARPDIIEIKRGATGTYILSRTMVEKYHAGEEAGAWLCRTEVEQEAELIMPLENEGRYDCRVDAQYVSTGKEIIALRADGVTETILTGVFHREWELGEAFTAVGYDPETQTIGSWWQTSAFPTSDGPAVIAEGVLEMKQNDLYFYRTEEKWGVLQVNGTYFGGGCRVWELGLDTLTRSDGTPVLTEDVLEYCSVRWEMYRTENRNAAAEGFMEMMRREAEAQPG